jgi:AcrR family transcriptional regulator
VSVDESDVSPRVVAGEKDLGRRGGRRQGASTTRDDILKAARRLFSEYGYRGATMRAIAREAQVDSALVHYFFSTKEGLFTAAIGDAINSSAILDRVHEMPEGTVGSRLILAFLGLWDDPLAREPMLAIIRSSMAYDEAARVVSDFVTTQVIGNVVKANTSTSVELRTTLIGTQIIGILVLRYLLKIEPFAYLAPEAVAAVLGPSIDRLLTADLDQLMAASQAAPA